MSSESVTLARASNRRKGSWVGHVLRHTILVLACAVIVLPCLFLLFGSLKTVSAFFSEPFALPIPPQWDNFSEAWEQGELGSAVKVSVIVTGLSILISTVLSALAAYAISCLRPKGATTWFVIFVAGLMIPVQLIMLAVFVLLRQVGLLGSLWSLVVVYSTFGLPLGVLILVGFMAALPHQVLEAARVDGASDATIFWRIVMPLSKPALATVAILNGIWIWNDVFVALVLATNAKTTTLPLAILNFFGTYSSDWGLIFAGVVISALPVVIVYVLATGRFTSGVTAGAVKE